MSHMLDEHLHAPHENMNLLEHTYQAGNITQCLLKHFGSLKACILVLAARPQLSSSLTLST